MTAARAGCRRPSSGKRQKRKSEECFRPEARLHMFYWPPPPPPLQHLTLLWVKFGTGQNVTDKNHRLKQYFLFQYCGSLQKVGNCGLVILHGWTAPWWQRTSSSDTRTASGLHQTLQFSKPHRPPHWGCEACSAGSYGILFMHARKCACACLSVCSGVRVFVLRPSPAPSP